MTVRVAYLLAITSPCIIGLLQHERSSSGKSGPLQGSGLASHQVWYPDKLAAVVQYHRLRPLPGRNIPDTQTHHTHHHVAYYTDESWDVDTSSWSVIDFSPDRWMSASCGIPLTAMPARHLPAAFGWHNPSAGASLCSALVHAETPCASLSISLSNYRLRDTAFVFHSLMSGRCSFTGLVTQHIQPATASVVRRKEAEKEKGMFIAVMWRKCFRKFWQQIMKAQEIGFQSVDTSALYCANQDFFYFFSGCSRAVNHILSFQMLPTNQASLQFN